MSSDVNGYALGPAKALLRRLGSGAFCEALLMHLLMMLVAACCAAGLGWIAVYLTSGD